MPEGRRGETRERMERMCVENALAVLSGTLPKATANRTEIGVASGSI